MKGLKMYTIATTSFPSQFIVEDLTKNLDDIFVKTF